MSLTRGGEGMSFTYWDTEADVDESGSSRVWYYGYSNEALKDEIRLNTTLRWGALGEYEEMAGWEYLPYVPLPEYEEVRLDLTCRAERVTMRMEQVGESENGKLRVTGGEIVFTPVMSYYSVEFDYADESSWLYIVLEDAKGNRLESAEGGGGYGRVRAFDPIPGTMYVTIVDMSASRTEPLDRVEVRLAAE